MIIFRLSIGILILLTGCAQRKMVANDALVVHRLEMAQESLRNELAQEQAKVSELKTEISKLKQRAHKAVAQRSAIVTKANSKSPIRPPSPKKKGNDGGEFTVVADSSHELMHFYFEGKDALEMGRVDDAIKSLNAFVAENPFHVYGDRAQFLLMEAYLEKKEFGYAVKAADLLEARHPYSFKMSEVLYKKGLALISMGKKDLAEKTFSKLQNLFPGDPYAQMAKAQSAKPQQNSNAEIRSGEAPAPLMPTIPQEVDENG